ncbi:MAG: ATPase [Gammaproteobacteria bacterium]|nr:ATPase [Gammaproteobacteria bacterium]
MNIETLRDVLLWSRKLHLQLQECMEHCADTAVGERERMLLVYLSDHENKLIQVLDNFEKTATTSALNTWCYEYIDKMPIIGHQHCSKPLANMAMEEIVTEVVNLHEQIVELYKHLLARSIGGSAHDLLQSLVDMETHESMLMVKNSLRLADM